MNKSPKKQRGVTLIFVTLLLIVLIAMAAFAVDFGYYFVIKNRLQNAVDAAALNGVDTIYRAPNLLGFPNTTFSSNANDAVLAAMQANNFNVVPTTHTDWWDLGSNINPKGYYHYPAVQVTVSKYPVATFFAKIFDISFFYATVTANAITAYPASINPVIPFVVSYCTLYNGWNATTGQPIDAGYTFKVGPSTGSSNQWNATYNCVAANLKGTATKNTTLLTVNAGDYKKLAYPVPSNVTGATSKTALKDSLGYLPNNTFIDSVGNPSNGKICTTTNIASTPCTYTLNANVKTGNITATDTLTLDSGSLGNWTPLVYDTSNAGGANNIGSFIPPITATTIPAIKIGQEIRITSGAPNTLYQQIQTCFNNATCKNKISVPVVNGLPCSSGNNCAATTISDPNYPLTGVSIAPIGVGLDNNLPVLGFACLDITEVSVNGNSSYIAAKLATGCRISGTAGGTQYYGVLLPPVLAN